MNDKEVFFIFVVLFSTLISSTEAKLPCKSRLRFLRPNLFKHCECTYTDWTEWEMVPNTLGKDVSAMGICESGEAFTETRMQVALGENCEMRVENRSMCKSTQFNYL